MIASCIDITSRKKVENELKKTKELLESLFDNVSDGIDIVDINFNIIRVNSAFQHIYQWTEEVYRWSSLTPQEHECGPDRNVFCYKRHGVRWKIRFVDNSI
ncbi:PAS domain-containing protein [Paenibacillus sp. V4I9]|uniref:PAS domain-containing protein n=1 Tax=Paenibacillus sp. V4I9 TaxID=3042308 RepID=UPI0035936518